MRLIRLALASGGRVDTRPDGGLIWHWDVTVGFGV
jgi:hypothetical protein